MSEPAPVGRFFRAIRAGEIPERPSPSQRVKSDLNLVPPIEEWTEEDHEFARLLLAAFAEAKEASKLGATAPQTIAEKINPDTD